MWSVAVMNIEHCSEMHFSQIISRYYSKGIYFQLTIQFDSIKFNSIFLMIKYFMMATIIGHADSTAEQKIESMRAFYWRKKLFAWLIFIAINLVLFFFSFFFHFHFCCFWCHSTGCYSLCEYYYNNKCRRMKYWFCLSNLSDDQLICFLSKSKLTIQ